MHLVVYLLSSLYSTPVCRFRLLSYGKFILFYFLTFLSSRILCYLSFLFLLNILLHCIANITGFTYILPQHDLALLAHLWCSFLYILYCHNLISHCWCSFLYIFYTATTWFRTAGTYDVLFLHIFILSRHDLALLSHITMFFLYTYFILSQSLYIFIVWFYCIQTCLLPYWREWLNKDI
jgi:hypothetical protein